MINDEFSRECSIEEGKFEVLDYELNGVSDRNDYKREKIKREFDELCMNEFYSELGDGGYSYLWSIEYDNNLSVMVRGDWKEFVEMVKDDEGELNLI